MSEHSTDINRANKTVTLNIEVLFTFTPNVAAGSAESKYVLSNVMFSATLIKIFVVTNTTVLQITTEKSVMCDN